MHKTYAKNLTSKRRLATQKTFQTGLFLYNLPLFFKIDSSSRERSNQHWGHIFTPFVTKILQIGAIQGSPEYNLGIRRNALMNDGKL